MNVQYVNRHTGAVMDCGTAVKEQSFQSVVDWAISQADPGDVVVPEGYEPITILRQPSLAS